MTELRLSLAEALENNSIGLFVIFVLAACLFVVWRNRKIAKVAKQKIVGRVVLAFLGAIGLEMILRVLPLLLKPPAGSLENLKNTSDAERAGFLAFILIMLLLGVYFALVEAFAPAAGRRQKQAEKPSVNPPALPAKPSDSTIPSQPSTSTRTREPV